ncbi:hypothetical protein FRC11_012805 [Ceratobasidium sp. 423]|nr:hypothetical protein FRC11_012805 [Ceratobasidium sp. 423]
MNNIVGSTLKPVVSCFAPASRPLASLANGSVQKSSPDRIQLPIILDFHSDEGKEMMQKWYEQQSATRFTSIEYRKDIDGQFRHEFVVARLDNSNICRFDRRAREDMRGHVLKDEGTISEDSAHVITLADAESRVLLDKSEVLLRVDIPEGEDLMFVLAVCLAIQSHPKAKSYSLLYYNCYFFSWTLVMIISRRAYKWEATIQMKYIWESVVFKSLEYIAAIQYSLVQVPGPTPAPNPRTLKTRRKLWNNEARDTPTHDHTRFLRSFGPLIARKPKILEQPKPRKLERPDHGGKWLRLRKSSSAGSEEQAQPPRLADENDIYGDMEQELRAHTPNFPPNAIEPLLLKSQLIPILMREVDLVLLRVKAAFPPDTTQLGELEISKLVDTFSHRIARDIPVILSVDVPDPVYIQPVLVLEPGEVDESKPWEDDFKLGRDVLRLGVGDGGHTNHEASWGSLTEMNDENLESTSPSLQKYIRKRMVAHFEQVQTFGFGNAEELIDRAEKSMTEIWISVIGSKKDELGFLASRKRLTSAYFF